MMKTVDPLRALLFITIPIMCAACPAFSQEPDKAPDPILTSLQIRLERELVDLTPAIKFEIPSGSSGKSLIMRYQTRKFMVYPDSKPGRLGHHLVEREGPDDEGILLRIHVQPKGEINQAVVPQTILRPYWKTYLNVHAVGDSDKQIYIALSYRGWTDKKLIRKIQKIAEQVDAAQPATAVDSKAEGKKKAKPESKRRPQ